MKNEKNFWEQFANNSNPDWNVKLAQHLELGGSSLSEHDVYVYAVDTSTGWIGAGAMTSANMQFMHDRIHAEPNMKKTVMDTAGIVILKNGQDSPEAGSEKAQECILAATSALTLTGTFETASRNGLAGHWLYITYKMNDGSFLGRPVYFHQPESGFAPMSIIKNILEQVIKQDTTNENTSVNKMMVRSGGAILAPEYGGPPAEVNVLQVPRQK